MDQVFLLSKELPLTGAVTFWIFSFASLQIISQKALRQSTGLAHSGNSSIKSLLAQTSIVKLIERENNDLFSRCFHTHFCRQSARLLLYNMNNEYQSKNQTRLYLNRNYCCSRSYWITLCCCNGVTKPGAYECTRQGSHI